MDNRQDIGLGELLQYENVAWYEDGQVKIMDRRVYPSKKEFVICKTYQEVVKAIRDMVTQSAGPYTAAGMGMALAAYQAKDEEDKVSFLRKAATEIGNARPTTSNRMLKVTSKCFEVGQRAIERNASPVDEIFRYVIGTLNARYKKMDAVGKNLYELLNGKTKILTHCFGETNIAMLLRHASKDNQVINLYCSETRPFFQGARLTSSVAVDQGHNAYVFSDNMVASMIENQEIEAFITAADTICMDGSVINKIGTSQVAIIAKHYGIPYFVTGIPDKNVRTSKDIEIEYRDVNELLIVNGVKNTKPDVKGIYPSFDTTPAHLVSAVVTDNGIYSPYNLEDYYKQGFDEFY
ncbi:s-methyl-5-thioribose-1-phosphate isomerase [Sporosarcina sp. CAU 1771]